MIAPGSSSGPSRSDGDPGVDSIFSADSTGLVIVWSCFRLPLNPFLPLFFCQSGTLWKQLFLNVFRKKWEDSLKRGESHEGH